MLKLGMAKEGLLRQHTFKWDRFEDIAAYGILSPELD
jgi:RimJ/RimL family protein N-acetyltransferase